LKKTSLIPPGFCMRTTANHGWPTTNAILWSGLSWSMLLMLRSNSDYSNSVSTSTLASVLGRIGESLKNSPNSH
jgi:hypothetical protein